MINHQQQKRERATELRAGGSGKTCPKKRRLRLTIKVKTAGKFPELVSDHRWPGVWKDITYSTKRVIVPNRRNEDLRHASLSVRSRGGVCSPSLHRHSDGSGC